jgi:demethylspheroidene O-methyltransferase
MRSGAVTAFGVRHLPDPAGLLNRIGARAAASARFRDLAARLPVLRWFARRDGERLFDIMAGFVYAQVLSACTDLDLFARASRTPLSPGAVAEAHGLDRARTETLLQAAAALGLFRRGRDGRYHLGRLGAAAGSVPGVREMIRHHRLFYHDMADPLALLRGAGDTRLAAFWPYVRGTPDPAAAADYSMLMRATQALVAQETLATLRLSEMQHLMDVGGGTGAFLSAVADRAPRLRLTLFDLPEVAAAARALPGADRFTIAGGSFRDPLPAGADAISLIRVCYDHDDATVAGLLARVHDALPPGGRLILSEPMSGGDSPRRAGDAYFGFYCMAMTTGQARPAATHMRALAAAGFTAIRQHRAARPFVTSVITAQKPVRPA